jgi:predicted Zn-ribbon and HTH transcriptional regulator
MLAPFRQGGKMFAGASTTHLVRTCASFLPRPARTEERGLACILAEREFGCGFAALCQLSLFQPRVPCRMSKIDLATFNEREKAEQVRKRLEEEGIQAEVYDEGKLQRFWFMSKPLAEKKILVEEDDYEKARALMDGLDVKEDLLHHAVRCPQCNSPRVQYPQFTRKFLTPTLVEIFCLLRVVDKEFYCEDCQYTWPREEKLSPETDALGWPKKDKPYHGPDKT